MLPLSELSSKMTLSADYRPAHVSYYVFIGPTLQGMSSNTIQGIFKIEEKSLENFEFKVYCHAYFSSNFMKIPEFHS